MLIMKSVRSSRLASLKMPFEASSSSHLHNLSSKAKNISSFCFRPKIQSVCQPTFSARNCSSRTQFRAIANNTTTKVTMFTSASRRVVSRVQRSAFSTAVKQPVVERRFAAPMVAAAAGLTAMAVASQQENKKTENSVLTHKPSVKDVEDKFGKYWPRNILILFGPPGAGKGTHGPKIEDMLGVPQLSTGDMLRAAVIAQSEVGKKAQAVMDSGGLVSDDIVVGIIQDRIKQPDCQFGFILDGFPRTLAQAKSLDSMLSEEGAVVTKVIELKVPDAVLEERICGRWIHKKSGRSYHVKYAPPKSMKKDSDGKPIAASMKDDVTGEALMQRGDDTASALVKRLDGYHSETVPILDHYKPHGVVRAVNANQGMDGVWGEVLKSLERPSA